MSHSFVNWWHSSVDYDGLFIHKHLQRTWTLEMKPQMGFHSAGHEIQLVFAWLWMGSDSHSGGSTSAEPLWWYFELSKKLLEAVNRLNYEMYQSEAILAFICSLSMQLCSVCNHCYCVLTVWTFVSFWSVHMVDIITCFGIDFPRQRSKK